jgi:lipid II:glycine glycyltransferase (peptidoglycan interpeptide bridge formation enzyme)
LNTARFATSDEIENWNSLVRQNPGTQSFFQEHEFLEFKSCQKISPWKIVYVVHELSKSKKIYVGYLKKHIIGLGEYWYSPFGPQATDTATVHTIIDQLRILAPKAFIVLLEPTIVVSSQENQAKLLSHLDGAIPTTPVQPNVHTIVVEIQDEDVMFSSLKQRTRRAIRQAQKAGVRIEMVPYGKGSKEIFYKIYKETSERAGFYIRSKVYYEEFWDRYNKQGKGDFFFAYTSSSKNPIAGAYIMYDDEKALYKDGASIRGNLPNGTLHLLHWEIIRWLRDRGVRTYDLHGVPPSWLQHDTTHRQYGLGIFKSSFGETTDQIGAVQWILRPKQAFAWQRGLKKLYFTFISRRGGYFF